MVDLRDYQGRKILLIFFRSTKCPFCAVHFWDLLQRYPRLHAQGMEVIAVMESTPAVTTVLYP